MIERNLRAFFQRHFVTPVVQIFATYASANKVTISALFIGLISAIFLGLNFNLTAITLLLLSGYLDILDGSIARAQNNSTNFGTVLDLLSDRLVDSFIIIALFLRDPSLALICILILISMLICMSSFLLVGLFTERESHKGFYYSPGLIERAESFIFFIAMILFPYYAWLIGTLFTLLVFCTAVLRLYQFYQQQKSNQIFK